MQQRTIESRIEIAGIGVHSGRQQKVEVRPAAADAGLVFNGERVSVEHVRAEMGFTQMGGVKTIEHLLSALAGLDIDNAEIESHAEEVPVLDGSAAPIVDLIRVRELDKPRRFLRVRRPVAFEDESARVELLPSAERVFDVKIDYSGTPAIGVQHERIVLDEAVYRARIAPARSFARMSDVEFLRAHGKALGASLETGIAVEGAKILNPEGLRDPHEFVLHKIMDAIGDMATAGVPILGEYKSFKGGHYHSNMLLKALFADEENYEIE